MKGEESRPERTKKGKRKSKTRKNERSEKEGMAKRRVCGKEKVVKWWLGSITVARKKSLGLSQKVTVGKKKGTRCFVETGTTKNGRMKNCQPSTM